MTQFINVSNKEKEKTVFTYELDGDSGWLSTSDQPDKFNRVVY